MATQLAGVAYAALPTAAKAADALVWPPRLVVIHDTSNNASAIQEAAYAASRPLSGATSAHFYVDTAGPLGSVPLNKQAWAAYSYANSHGWHIEMCGYNAGMRGAVPAATIARTAGLVRQLCDLADIPMVKLSPAEVKAGKRGICGHWDITIGLDVGTHDDPGPKFDWDGFIAAVKEDDMLTPEEVRHQAALALYDVLWVAATGKDANGLTYDGKPGAIGAAVRTNLQTIVVGPIIDALRSADAVDEAKLAAALAPAVASAVVAGLPALPDTALTKADVEAAVREVFADAGQAD